MYDSGRGARYSFGASSVISTSVLLASVFMPLVGGAGEAVSDPGLGVETSRSGVDAGVVPRLFFLYGPRFPGARTGATGIEVEAGEALETGVGGAAVGWDWGRDAERAARASASERWLAKVFWDWRIFRTAGVTFPWLTIDTCYVS